MVLCFLYFFVLNIFWVVFHTLFIVFFRLSYVFRFGTAHHLHPHLLTASLAQSNTVASTAFFLSSAFVFWSFGVDDTSSSFLLYHRSKGQKIRQHQPSASCVTQLTDYISNIRILPSSHRLSYQVRLHRLFLPPFSAIDLVSYFKIVNTAIAHTSALIFTQLITRRDLLTAISEILGTTIMP